MGFKSLLHYVEAGTQTKILCFVNAALIWVNADIVLHERGTVLWGFVNASFGLAAQTVHIKIGA